MGFRITKDPDLSGFSPVAGIQWVETFFFRLCDHGGVLRFSPVAGIQWVETWVRSLRIESQKMFQSRCRDSVG